MKFFGEYLVEKGLITETTLLQTVMEQLSTLPSWAEVLHKEGLLSDADLLAALRYQARNKVDFIRSCKILGFWNDKLENQVKKSVDAQREPLGQLLIKKELISADQLTQVLQDYFHHIAVETNDLHTFKFRKSDSGFLDSLSAAPIDEARFEIQVCMAQVKVDRENYRSHANNLVKELNCLRGIFRFIRAEISEKLSEKLVETIQALSVFEQSSQEWTDFENMSEEVLSTLWDLADKFRTDGSEEAWWTENKGTFHRLYTALDELTSRRGKKAA